MALNFLPLLTLFSFILLLLPSILAQSNTTVSHNTICRSTPDPAYCRSVLSNSTNTNAYEYGRFSVRKSLSQSKKFKLYVEKYFKKHKSSLSTSAIRALEDCRYLAATNMDFLTTTFQTVGSSSKTLSAIKAEDTQTLLSAILTNQQTCSDGILAASSAWSVKSGITVPMSNDTKLYSVSLALFTKAFVPKKKKVLHWQPTKTQRVFKNGHLPLKMSSKTRAVYETVSRRKLLQTEFDDQVLVSDIVVVSQNGTGNFSTISDAVAAAPNNTKVENGYFLIYVTAGVYDENVNIAKNKKYLMMVGDGINQTIITGNRSVVDGWTTFNSATFVVVAPNFVAVNITIRNTAGAIKHQAVALRSGADLSTFYSCSFEAYQDTLYTHSLRQFYRECDIYGTVDFIFGNAAVVLQNCNLYPRRPMDNQFNAITAQGRTDPNQNTGTSIINCTIRPADDLGSSNVTIQTYLGRPWKEYSRTVYLQNFMDGFINAAGWRAWSGDFALNTSYYAEYGNLGPGANTTGRVTWAGFHLINATEAANFTVANFISGDDWLPDTAVPYSGGLV